MSPWSRATWFQCAPLKATHRPSRPLKDTPPQSLRIAARQTLPPRHVPGLLRVQDLMFLVVLSMGMFLVFHDVLQSETKAVLCTNKLAYFCGMLLCLSFFFITEPIPFLIIILSVMCVHVPHAGLFSVDIHLNV